MPLNLHVAFKKYCNINNKYFQKNEYISYIKTRALYGISATASPNKLEIVYGVHLPKYSSVAKWVVFFNEGRENLND